VQTKDNDAQQHAYIFYGGREVKLLEEVAKQFGTSEPIFVATFSGGDAEEINFELKNEYRPQPGLFQDPIAKLLASKYQERFDQKLKKFVHYFEFKSIYKTNIVGNIQKFYLEHTDLKNPKQSRLYKWLDTMDNQYNHPASEGFIGLYRYIVDSGGADKCGNASIQNVLAILELMKEKYEIRQEAD
jgi:hypothetical protein